MIAMRAKVRDETRKVKKKAKQGSFKSLGHAAAALRLTSRRSIRRRKKASAEGQPPSTRRGELKEAILYAIEKPNDVAVIGADEAKVGESASAHEHGGRYKRQRYPKRPFMGPSLVKLKTRLPRFWRNSVRGR